MRGRRLARSTARRNANVLALTATALALMGIAAAALSFGGTGDFLPWLVVPLSMLAGPAGLVFATISMDRATSLRKQAFGLIAWLLSGALTAFWITFSLRFEPG